MFWGNIIFCSFFVIDIRLSLMSALKMELTLVIFALNTGQGQETANY